jgi:PAS domain S-box-containing protein
MRYGAAALASALAAWLRYFLQPIMGNRTPFATFYIAVVGAAYLLGTGPAIVVGVAGAFVGIYLFLPPLYSLALPDVADLAWLTFYVLITSSIIAAMHAQRLARKKLEVEIVERMRAQEAEAEQRMWYETTLRSIGDAVIATDNQGKVTFLNGLAESLTGWTPADAAGRAIGDVFVIQNEETGAPVEIPVERVIREGRVVGLANHTVLRNRDGFLAPIDDSAAPILDQRGVLLGVVLVFRDISERRRSEQALEHSLADLEQFAYVASHDLQEPLRSISAFTTMLQRHYGESVDRQAAEYMHFIVEGSRRLQQLISDLLEYSRAGANALCIAEVPTEQILQDALDMLRAHIESSGAVVTHGALPIVFADRMKLAQVLQNLIGNALKFHSDQPCRIHITALDQDTRWCFSVEDNGVGFDPAYSDRIFGMFQRLSSGNLNPGSGIGLAISKRIVESHNGRIWADSQPGRGSTFRFTIPKQAVQQFAAAAGKQA